MRTMHAMQCLVIVFAVLCTPAYNAHAKSQEEDIPILSSQLNDAISEYLLFITDYENKALLNDYAFYEGHCSEDELVFELYYGKINKLYEIDIFGGEEDPFLKYTRYRLDHDYQCASYYMIWLKELLKKEKIKKIEKWKVVKIDLSYPMSATIQIEADGVKMELLVFPEAENAGHFGLVHLVSIEERRIDDYLSNDRKEVSNGNDSSFRFVLDPENNECLKGLNKVQTQ